MSAIEDSIIQKFLDGVIGSDLVPDTTVKMLGELLQQGHVPKPDQIAKIIFDTTDEAVH